MAANTVGRDLKAIFKESDSPLMSVTFHRGTFWYFKWPYHAKVIKMLEKISRIIVAISGLIPFQGRRKIPAACRRRGR